MTHRVWRRALAGFVIVCGLVMLTLAGGQTARGAAAVTLNGAGATFPYPIYSRWFIEYNRMHPEVRINYQPIGSGGGIEQVKQGTVDFGASDAPLSDDQLKQMGRSVLLMPTVAGAIAISYNIPGLATGLKLTRQNIALIYLGTITKWNDSRLTADNPTMKLPSLPITVVYRSDGSGTTFHFTTFLSNVSVDWKSKVGAGTSVEWPVGIGGKGSDGVAGAVQQTPGGIGYVELAYVMQNHLSYALVQNPSGHWIAPTLSATVVAAALGAAQMVQTKDVRVAISNSPAPDAYPICGFTYLLIPAQQTDSAKGQALVSFLWWAIHDGESDAPLLLYARLPAPVLSIDEGIVKQVTYQGKALMQ
ncbi:MAG TPA: phosphate ABC transporter substrate-binding protein PstS [bacterium]|nr:phosphate ABC transporter substrate-binding protein PstS [bacterium]